MSAHELEGRFTARHVPFRVACAFIREHHRTHKPPVGAIVCLGLFRDGAMVGVGVLGRPSARMSDDGRTAEITRSCVLPTVRFAASALDARLRRLAQALGYDRTQTYTLEREGGASLRAAGAVLEKRTRGGEWSRSSRPRAAACVPEPKLRWAWTHPVAALHPIAIGASHD